jgi:protease-4
MGDFFKGYFLFLAKVLTLAIIVFVVVPAVLIGAAVSVSQSVTKETHATVGSPAKKVAVIEVTDMIISAREVVDELYRQVEDSTVRGIVLRVDSLGGVVGPSQEIYAAVKRLKARKPIVVSMGGVAASGGLYVSLAADKIYAQPGTMSGSIGVIMQVPNFAGIASQLGVSMVTIKSGALKDAGNSFRAMTPEEEVYLHDLVKVSHEEFVNAVATGRSMDIAKVRAFADGRIILGSQAKELGLVDELGDVYDAAGAIFDILKDPLVAGETPLLYYPNDKYKEFKKLFEASSTMLRQLFMKQVTLSYVM